PAAALDHRVGGLLFPLALRAVGNVPLALAMDGLALPLRLVGRGVRGIGREFRYAAVGGLALGLDPGPNHLWPFRGIDLLLLVVLFHGRGRDQGGTRRISRSRHRVGYFPRTGYWRGGLDLFPSAAERRGLGRKRRAVVGTSGDPGGAAEALA